jgi:PHD/YefM family antitoxin component YafN of YafNO toxin-antitoxin module
MSSYSVSQKGEMAEMFATLAKAEGEMTLETSEGPVAVLLTPERYALLRATANLFANPEWYDTLRARDRQIQEGKELGSELGSEIDLSRIIRQNV